MSYPQGYGQPQAQMQQSQLPYPAHQMIAAPLQVMRGQPPVMPPVQVAAPLQPYLPLLVTDSIEAIQAKAGTNPLRCFLFNQMVQNNYNNNDFFGFVDGVAKLVDMRMAQNAFPDVQQAIIQCAILYAELMTAANVLRYPELGGMISPDAQMSVQQVLQNLNRINHELQQFMQMQMQQQRQVVQINNPGMYQQPMNTYIQPVQSFQAPNSGSANWRDRGAAHMAAGHMPSNSGPSLFSGGGGGLPSDPMAARFEQAGRAQRGNVRPAETSVHVKNIHEARQDQAVNIMGNTTSVERPVQVATPKQIKADESMVMWSPSEKFPVNIAFNPEEADLYYQIGADGVIQPLIKLKEKTEMDMASHFQVPAYAAAPPAAMGSLDSNVRIFETKEALGRDAESLKELQPIPELNVAYKDKSFFACLAFNEAWLRNNVQLALMAKKGEKTNVFRTCGVMLEPLVCVTSPKAMIIDIAASRTIEEACKKMNAINVQIESGIYAHGDAKALTFVNNRLTQHLNNFLKKQVAVPNGWVDSFMADAHEVIGFIGKKYSPTFAKALIDKQNEIISQALLFIEEDLEKEQNSNLFPDSEDLEKNMAGLDVTYFYEYVSFTSLDLFSTELKMQIPKTEVSVGVFEKQTPLLRQVAENIFTHQRALQVNFNRHLVQTADGATLEITQSAVTDDFFLVCDAHM